LWLGTAGLTSLLLVGALHYVAYPRLASAYVSDPGTAFEVFRPLRLLDHALRHLGPFVGLGLPALLAAITGWRIRRLPLLIALLGLVACAAHVAALAVNYQALLLNSATTGLTALWTLVYGAALLFARADAPESQPQPPARKSARPPQKRRARKSAAPASTKKEASTPQPDPYTTLPDETPETPPETPEIEEDHTRWRPPPE
jgi:hypothetical protein